MDSDATITTLAHVIQLAVAPVFLLTGIGALLSVLAGRLGRVIDRSRVLEGSGPCKDKAREALVTEEFVMLARRGHLINIAISLCTSSALLICLVIVALFVGAFLKTDLSIAIGLLFILAMLSLIGGLLFFLREIHHGMTVAPVGRFEQKGVGDVGDKSE